VVHAYQVENAELHAQVEELQSQLDAVVHSDDYDTGWHAGYDKGEKDSLGRALVFANNEAFGRACSFYAARIKTLETELAAARQERDQLKQDEEMKD
jgi:hypothetical protein